MQFVLGSEALTSLTLMVQREREMSTQLQEQYEFARKDLQVETHESPVKLTLGIDAERESHVFTVVN